MSLFESIFGKGDAWYGAPLGPIAPQRTPNDLERMQRALALHPRADPHFNLQPTIDMLEIADMYGFKVTRS